MTSKRKLSSKTSKSPGMVQAEAASTSGSGEDLISPAPVSGSNSQRGADLGNGPDYELSDERAGGTDFEEEILAKIRDLGDSLDRFTDQVAGDGKINDALERLKGRFGRPRGDRGRETSQRDYLI